MKLLCCVVTFGRLEYTKRCLHAFFTTKGRGDHLVVVDNASTDGTREWLQDVADPDHHIRVILGDRNLFPGAATNIGWHEGLKHHDAGLLMRLDNDIELLPGWREEVERAFQTVPDLGLFGLLNRHEDYDGQQPVTPDPTGTVNVHWDQVGGNSVTPRRYWDDGLRWIPGAWTTGHVNEDSVFAAEIRHRGGLVGVAIPTIANNMSFHQYDAYPEYYNQTAALRGLVPELSV